MFMPKVLNFVTRNDLLKIMPTIGFLVGILLKGMLEKINMKKTSVDIRHIST